MIHNKHIIFLPLNIPISNFEIKQIFQEISSQKKSAFYSCIYRGCDMLPLYMPGGYSPANDESHKEIVQKKTQDYQQQFHWTKDALNMPFTRKFLTDKIFPFLNAPARTIILISPPNGEIKVHIDCSAKASTKKQHKLRIVISGCVKGLWFLGSDNKKHFINTTNPIYVIDGSHPHGAINESKTPKFTICIGAPWSGDEGESYFQLLRESYKKYHKEALLSSDIGTAKDIKWLYKENLEPLLSKGIPDPR